MGFGDCFVTWKLWPIAQSEWVLVSLALIGDSSVGSLFWKNGGAAHFDLFWEFTELSEGKSQQCSRAF